MQAVHGVHPGADLADEAGLGRHGLQRRPVHLGQGFLDDVQGVSDEPDIRVQQDFLKGAARQVFQQNGTVFFLAFQGAVHARRQARNQSIPFFDVVFFAFQLGQIAVLEQDRSGRGLGFIRFAHHADAASGSGAPDGFEFNLGDGGFVPGRLQGFPQTAILLDFQVFPDDGVDDGFADVHQRIAHAFQVMQDHQRGHQIARMPAGMEAVHDPV